MTTGAARAGLTAAVLIAVALGPAAALAQSSAGSALDLSEFAAGPGDSADAPGPHWDRFHDGATARAAIDACLAETSEPSAPADATDCLGLTTETCLSYWANQTTLGSIKCAGGELEAWDGVLNDAYAQAMAALDDGAQTALRDAQRKWIAYRDAACGVWREVFRGGSMARQIAADCLREQTGRRAIEVVYIAEAARL